MERIDWLPPKSMSPFRRLDSTHASPPLTLLARSLNSSTRQSTFERCRQVGVVLVYSFSLLKVSS